MKRRRWSRLLLHWQTVCAHNTPKLVKFDLGLRFNSLRDIMVSEVKQIFYHWSHLLSAKYSLKCCTQQILKNQGAGRSVCVRARVCVCLQFFVRSPYSCEEDNGSVKT